VLPGAAQELLMPMEEPGGAPGGGGVWQEVLFVAVEPWVVRAEAWRSLMEGVGALAQPS
jgi:hypothetical protein